MEWYWILLIGYFGINLIVAVFVTTALAIDGLFGKWWGWILFFVTIMIIGTPLAIWGCLDAMTG